MGWLTVTESRLPHFWQPSQKAGDGGARLLDSHAGGGQEAGSGVDTHPGEVHQDWGDEGCSKFEFVSLLSSSTRLLCPSDVPNELAQSSLPGLLSNLHEPKEPSQFPDSSVD